MQYNYFDIHSHFNLPQFAPDLLSAVTNMQQHGVGTICVGVDLASSEQAIKIADEYANIFATVGMHPTDTDEAFVIDEYRKLLAHKKVVAIGECGLDYFRSTNVEVDRARQGAIFREHIVLAKESGKPLMIHARPSKGTMDAYEEVLEILEAESSSHHPASQSLGTPPQAGGETLHANFHFFVGNLEIAKRIVENGWTMSFDGPITFSTDYDEIIKYLPLENIMAETDAPFAAPAPYRGKRCEPWMVEEVYKKIAQIKGLPLPDVTEAIQENIKRVFKI